jgi:two-component system response regulator ResD
MARILVVDDEEKIRNLINKYATYEGYEIFEAANGKEAFELCQGQDFDLIVMDVMMPEMDGFKAYQKIKEVKDIPCIFLTALNEEYDKIYGFDLGADDYVAKPFSPKELIARIKAVLNRTLKEHKSLSVGSLVIDLNSRLVTVDGERVDLSLKEYELLQLFISNPGIALSREKIMEKIWGYDYYGDDRTLDTHIKLLRKDIKDYGKKIVTIRGVGYRFEP